MDRHTQVQQPTKRRPGQLPPTPPHPSLACMGMGMPCCPGPMGRTMNMGCPPGAIICTWGGEEALQ